MSNGPQTPALEAHHTPVTALRFDPAARARALLNQVLEAGDVLGRDQAGRTVIQLAVDDRTLEQLLTFDAGSEDLEDEGEADEAPPVLSFDRALPRQVYHYRESAKALIRELDAGRFPDPHILAQFADDLERRRYLDRCRSLLFVAVTRAKFSVLISFIGAVTTLFPGVDKEGPSASTPKVPREVIRLPDVAV